MTQRNAILLMERLAYDGRTEETERPDQPLGDFIKRKGGINKCAARFARRLERSQSDREREGHEISGIDAKPIQ